MKTKTTKTTLLIVLLLSACAPAVSPSPTGTALPSPTRTAQPTSTVMVVPTQTPTPAPENIADAQDLPVWVDEFVHAYGGKVTLNGIEVDASRLTEEIRKNGEIFTQVKPVNGTQVSFLVVNDIPLALRNGNGAWQEASMARLSEITGVIFEFAPRIPEDRLPQFISILKKVAGKNARFIFPGQMDTCRIYNNFSSANWTTIISNWEAIRQDLNTGKVPQGYPYEWQGAYDVMNFVQKYVEAPQFRAQHVMEIRLNYCMLADSIINLWQTGKFSQADMLKVLEFVVRTRVIQFPEITNWDVEDEMIAADVVYQTGGDDHYRFWLNATGKTPVELASLVAGWIKHDRPAATTYIVEDAVFDNNDPNANWQINAFDRFIKGLNESQAKVDRIIIENNLWIYSPPNFEAISKKIDDFGALGFSIGGSETMVVTGDQAINGEGRARQVQVADRNLAQAELYRNLFSLYLSKGITDFGFGGIGDYNAWTDDAGLPNANPLLFDHDFRAKPAYFAILQVLYEQLP